MFANNPGNDQIPMANDQLRLGASCALDGALCAPTIIGDLKLVIGHYVPCLFQGHADDHPDQPAAVIPPEKDKLLHAAEISRLTRIRGDEGGRD
jgi:hypothetical protein